MIAAFDQARERTRSALMTLSTIGAAVAGAGTGALLASSLRPLAWIIVAVGLIAHLFGMVGVRRVLSTSGYVPPSWQRAAYWLCWAAIAAISAYALVEAAR